MTNPLDPVMDWYRTANDSMRVTERALNKNIKEAFTARHVFSTLAVAESRRRIEAAKQELGRVVVLMLVAVFERTLRDFLLDIPRSAISSAEPVHQAVREAVLDDIEFWRSEDVIDVFQAVPKDLRGLIKNIIKYRNWVAHGHWLAKPPPANIDPVMAYRRLSEFLQKAGLI
jgi:hypothetical protein